MALWRGIFSRGRDSIRGRERRIEAFMLFVERKISERSVEPGQRLALLERLQERGLVPLIRSTRLHCYETALLGSERASEMESSLAAEVSDDGPYVRGDIFCFEEFALFLVFEEDEAEQRGMRAGIVYEAGLEDARKELDAFCRNVSEALIGVGSGSLGPDALESIEWREQQGPEELPSVAGFAAGERAAPVAAGGSVPPEASLAAELLEDTAARRLLRRIREAHADARVPELLLSLKGRAETEGLIRRLAEAGLLRREVVISCRQSERALFRLPTPDALSVITASNAICSECGANIADEKIEELVVPTAMAATLLEDGSWLLNRVRSILVQLGIPERQISAGPIAAQGEAYMLAGVCREPFLFILKDGDVTGAHARQALGKQTETEAPHLVVIATGKIHDEARQRLREHARRRSRSESQVEVLLIEGVETASGELRQAFERVSTRTLTEELSMLDASLGLSAGRMMTTRFRLMERSGALKDLAASAVGALAGSLPEF